MPLLAQYWRLRVSSASVSAMGTSSFEMGSRSVSCNDVIGKVSAFGFPARREMRPGRESSSGSSARTTDGNV